MKMQYVLVGLSVLASVVLLGLINVRKKEVVKEQKNTSFQSTKLRVTYDVQGEYRHELIRAQNLLDKTKALVNNLGSELSQIQAKEVQQKNDLEACLGQKKQATDNMGSVEEEISNAKNEFEKQKVTWAAQVTSLRQQAEQRSKVCDFVKKESVEGICVEMNRLKKRLPPSQKFPSQKFPSQKFPSQKFPCQMQLNKMQPNKMQPNKMQPNKMQPNKMQPNKMQPNKMPQNKMPQNKIPCLLDQRRNEHSWVSFVLSFFVYLVCQHSTFSIHL
uniref:Uncharacterized protein n=1 Tax=Esox lucius TaxID=8010 RepID=A0AAY5L5V4_ESOLU